MGTTLPQQVLRPENIDSQIQRYLGLIEDIRAPGELKGLAQRSSAMRSAKGRTPKYPCLRPPTGS